MYTGTASKRPRHIRPEKTRDKVYSGKDAQVSDAAVRIERGSHTLRTESYGRIQTSQTSERCFAFASIKKTVPRRCVQRDVSACHRNVRTRA